MAMVHLNGGPLDDRGVSDADYPGLVIRLKAWDEDEIREVFYQRRHADDREAHFVGYKDPTPVDEELVNAMLRASDADVAKLIDDVSRASR